MNQFLIKIVVIVSTLLFVGCAKTTTVTNQSEVTSHSVEVFYSPPTERTYTELGMINTQTGQTIFHDRSNEGMVKKLQDEAEKLGADAIIVRASKEGTTGFERGNAEAIAIKFTDNK
jgi:PBP1b-binding outer membrane lipoprotein LpoB